jgi:hypothetical protein
LNNHILGIEAGFPCCGVYRSPCSANAQQMRALPFVAQLAKPRVKLPLQRRHAPPKGNLKYESEAT